VSAPNRLEPVVRYLRVRPALFSCALGERLHVSTSYTLFGFVGLTNLFPIAPQCLNGRASGCAEGKVLGQELIFRPNLFTGFSGPPAVPGQHPAPYQPVSQGVMNSCKVGPRPQRLRNIHQVRRLECRSNPKSAHLAWLEDSSYDGRTFLRYAGARAPWFSPFCTK
jgi:hypothetical protein